MPEIDEPELHVIKFAAGVGAEWRAKTERQRSEARTRYLAHLTRELTESEAVIALDALTSWSDVTSGERCACSCHPRLPESDFHDYGFGCPCRQTADERRRNWDEWMAEEEEFRASPEGERITSARKAEEDELAAWLSLHPDIVVRSHGGMAPEQWWGDVDGRSFYFRERHDRWRVEVDLRPSGEFSTVWLGGDLDDPASFEPRSVEVGDVIAEGTTAVAGYGETALGRLLFIVDVIRTHFLRETCTVHIDDRSALETFLGRPPAWCPSCGTRLSPVSP